MATTLTILRGFLGNSPDCIADKQTNEMVGASFRVATTERYRDVNGEWQNRGTDWFTVKVWGNLAENCYHSIHKGDPVLAVGRLRLETWVNSEGQERSAMVLTASSVGLDLNQCTAVKRSSIKQEERKQREFAEGMTENHVEKTEDKEYELAPDDAGNPEEPF